MCSRLIRGRRIDFWKDAKNLTWGKCRKSRNNADAQAIVREKAISASEGRRKLRLSLK